jgi:hypothetical protein
MPTPTIPAGNLFMNATTYTGNGATQTITNGVAGQAFQPDFVWIKSRSTTYDHALFDSVRGTNKRLYSDLTNAEFTVTDLITSFNSNGFSLGSDGSGNNNGTTYVGWNWKAGGTAVSNTSGSITSSVNANTTSGFSIVTYTGNLTAAGTATVGHGLGVAPAMIIFKGRNAVTSWPVFHTSLTSWNYCCILDGTNAQINQTSNGSMSAPTSTVFSTNWTTGMNTNGTTEVAYCWAPIAGFSAFGSYTGNGSADGPFCYTGFRPRWIMIKRSDSTSSWYIIDTSINPYNEEKTTLYANLSNAEGVNANFLDGLSNGFKMRESGVAVNGATYIYAAFAENPFKYANAR